MAKVKIRTVGERQQAGKSLREKCPRLSHGKVILGQGKRDIIALIKASNEGRLENLIPIRPWANAPVSVCVFSRHGADTSARSQGYTGKRDKCSFLRRLSSMNFGGFATPERNLVFDINDFDETLPAPFEWDVKRLAASFVIAARWRGFRRSQVRDMAVQAVSAYRESMTKRAGTGVLEGWYSRITLDDILAMVGRDADLISRVKKRIAEAHRATHEHVFQKITAPVRALPRIVNEPPLLYHVDKSVVNERVIAAFFKRYRETLAEERRMLLDRFKLVDVAMKVVGVGSVGTRCYVVLLLAAPDDPLFLQVKEARPSVLERYTGRARVPHNGQRVVIGQRLMQSASDIFLGWSRGPLGRDFYIRQLRDMKVAPAVESMTPQAMRVYAKVCGLTLARAHDKAGDAAMIAGYLGSIDHFDEAIGDYAVGYADQVERDYETFVKAIRSGRLKSDLSPSRLATALR